jgi:bacillithiol system protein YtxJ
MPAFIKYIETADELDSIFTESIIRPLIVLKHSRSCGISAHILERLTHSVDHEINVIVVQSHRDLSNLVEDRTGHRHHSPQIFVLADGKPVYHATHYGIDCAAVNLKMNSNGLAAARIGSVIS